MRTDFLDYPTAWAIQDEGGLEHHPKCSANAAMLCDCGAVEAEWERRRTAAAASSPAGSPSGIPEGTGVEDG